MTDDGDRTTDSEYLPSAERRRRRRRSALPQPGPGACADDPMIIDDDDDGVVVVADAPPNDRQPDLDLSDPTRVRWTVRRAIFGKRLLLDDKAEIVDLTFTKDAIRIGTPGKSPAERRIELSSRPRPLADFAVNTCHSPFFIAIRPRQIVEGLSTAERIPEERYIILFFDARDEARADDLVARLLDLCPTIAPALTRLAVVDLLRFDAIHPRPAPVRKRTRSAARAAERPPATKTRRPAFLEYPLRARQRMALHEDDLGALDPGAYINDSIVDFYLAYLGETRPDPRVHFFSSFFYRRYVSAATAGGRGVDHAAAYQAVRKWSRHVDLFDKDYLVMPVCENVHWTCVIACHPGRAGDDVDDDPAAATTTQRRLPCLLLFDSLGSHHGPKLFRMLRNFLAAAWKDAQASQDVAEVRSFTTTTMPGVVVQVPQQANDCDCGLFLLEYVERFLERPFEDLSRPAVANHRDWFDAAAVGDNKRDELRALLLSLSEQWLAVKAESQAAQDDDDDAGDVGRESDAANGHVDPVKQAALLDLQRRYPVDDDDDDDGNGNAGAAVGVADDDDDVVLAPPPCTSIILQ
ncbi:Ubiquitin-like protease family profile domain-containing protein [Plasmodiophora brassicae]